MPAVAGARVKWPDGGRQYLEALASQMLGPRGHWALFLSSVTDASADVDPDHLILTELLSRLGLLQSWSSSKALYAPTGRPLRLRPPGPYVFTP